MDVKFTYHVKVEYYCLVNNQIKTDGSIHNTLSILINGPNKLEGLSLASLSTYCNRTL
jgi:hypothetical protein